MVSARVEFHLFKFLKDLAQVYLFDDNLKIKKLLNKKFINLSEITK